MFYKAKRVNSYSYIKANPKKEPELYWGYTIRDAALHTAVIHL